MASWRVHIARDLEDSISKFREDYVQQLPSSSGIIPAENDGAQPARDLGAHRNAPVPNVTPGDSLRSPSPPTTATADSRGYRYTDIEVTWVLDYISVLLQRNPNIRNMEIAKAVFEKVPLTVFIRASHHTQFSAGSSPPSCQLEHLPDL
jgi:hypothetical protein